jgi:ligand-binding sensor domain-containing protein
LFMLLASLTLQAETGIWKNFTSMKDVRGVVRQGNVFWAATSGGLFAWEKGSGSYELFTNAEGLQNNDLTAIGSDYRGDIWTGTSTGIIHVYSPQTGTWRYILDIATADQTNKRINSFTMHGDTVLICTEFGLSMFKINDFEFGDTYTKFGSLSTNVRIRVSSASIFHDSIWAAISDGQSINRLAVGSLSIPNLLPPESWSLRIVDGPGIAPTTLSVLGDRLYTGTTGGLYYLDGGSWVAVGPLVGKDIVSTSSSGSVLAVCTSNETFIVDTQDFVTMFDPLPFSATSVTLGVADEPVLGSLMGGILTFENSWVVHLPNGPNSNQFINITVDPDGNLWGGSGFNGNGTGFYRYDGTDWKSFTVQSNSLPTNDYYIASVGCNGSVWTSSWGRGVVEIPSGSNNVDPARIYGTNVGMEGLVGDSTFVVVSSVVCDSRGNHWMSIILARDGRILVVRKPDGSWITLPVKIGLSRISTLIDNIPVDRSLAVDAFDNLWGVVRDGTYKGVFSLGNNGSIDDSVEALLTETDGLPSNDARTIVADLDNDIWIGTDKGIGIVLDPSNPKRSGSIASFRPLNGLVINTIAVDPLNQKWVGTTEGVILLSPDGTQQLASFTVENTDGKLIDNDVKSITFDGNTGTVYFGTLSGLASLTTAAVSPKTAFEQLMISPNPYLIPNTISLTVDGLVENSLLKILSIDGRVIREIESPGGRVGFWDGKDEEGNDVSSGVYLVVAYSSEDGTQVATGKVAIIRR